MSDEMTQLVAVFGDDDEPFFYEGDPAQAADSSARFAVEVPSSVWDACSEAREAYFAALQKVRDAAGLDPDGEGKLATCCSEWAGYEHPERVWWNVVLQTDGSGKTWPARGSVSLAHFDSPQEAKEYIDQLPDEFYAHYGTHTPAQITRERLVVERGGSPGYSSECHRCGWTRNEHEKSGVSDA